MAFNTNQAIVAEYYVASLGRLPDQAGFDYWTAQLDAGMTPTALMGLFLDRSFPEVATRYPEGQKNEELIESFYGSVFGRESDVDGLVFWSAKLDTMSQSEVLAEMLAVAKDPANYIDGAHLEGQKVLAEAALDTTTTEPEVPSVPGETFTLTDGRDTKFGTDKDDNFVGLVGQNKDGALANAFATGDYIDGKDGTDTLYATLMNDNEVDSGTNFNINAKTVNVEIAKFEVLDEGVVVDAGNMDSVREFWSLNSDASGLTLVDVRLGSKLSITKDITFGMKDVDYDSDLTVGLDSQSFKNSGEKKFNSKIVVEVGDANKNAGSTNPLELIKLTLEFTFGGQNYVFADMISEDGTYEGLKATITSELAKAGLNGLVVEFGSALTQIFAKNDTVPLLYSGAKQIIITDPNGTAFTNFKSGIAAKASEESSNPVSNTSAQDPNQSSTLIESNLILDNAGRGSTAGDVEIGAMSNSNAGIEQFNVTVQGTNGSAIKSLNTTNAKLQNIIIKSAVDSTASLEIGATQANLKLIDASGFKGTNLMLGTTVEVTGADVLNLTTLNANIASNVTFHADVQAGANYTYTTGTGNDTIKVTVDGDAVDTIGEGLAINAGNGNNTVTVDMQGGNVSVATTELLDNLSITTGSGADKVTLIGGDNNTVAGTDGDADFNISTGAGSDFVYINSFDDADSVAAAKGQWTVGTSTGAQPFVEKVLYKAELTVTFAGFEQKVTVNTTAANNFVATQVDINNAIIAAIKANPELSRLLTYELGTGSQELTINSTVEGANNLAIDLFQPTVVATGAVAGTSVNFVSSDLSAIEAGLLKTGVVTSSGQITTDAHAIAILDGTAGVGTGVGQATVAYLDGNLDATGAAAGIFSTAALGGSADETAVTNVSTINLGTGANDLVVLNSHADSTQTIVFSAAWGKVSVVNFEDGATNTNILDFSGFLTTKTSVSGSPTSAVEAPVVLNSGTTGDNNGLTIDANSVSVTSVATQAAFDALTGDAILADLNLVTGAADVITPAYTNMTTTNLYGSTTYKGILMVENGDNAGEYKVFELVVNDATASTATVDFNDVTLIGTIDFGDTVTLVDGVNLA